MSDELENIPNDDIDKLAAILGADEQDDSPPAEDAEEDATPAEGEASGEEAEEREPETAIAAPASWDAEARAEFAKLPPEAQKIIARRESEREKAINQRLSEIATERKAAEAARTAIENQRQHVSDLLSQHEAVIRSQLMGEFADLRTPADLSKLAGEDPQRYLRYMARMEELRAINAQQQQIQQERQKEQTAEVEKYHADQMKILAEKAPGFLDGKNASKNRERARNYLIDKGFTDQEINAIADHRVGLILKEALEAIDLKAKLKAVKEKKVATAPKVSKPGPADSEDEDIPKNKAAVTKLARYGSTDQQAAYLTRLMERGR